MAIDKHSNIIKSDNNTLAQYATNFVAKNFEIEVATLIRDAQIKTDKMLKDAKDEVEAIKQTAKDEGYKIGFEEGKKEGNLTGEKEGAIIGEDKAYTERKAETEKALGTLSKTLIEMLSFFEGKHEEILRQANAELLNLALAVAEKVILSEIQNPADLLKRNVEAAIALCGKCTELEIQVHVDFTRDIKEYTPELKAIFEGLSQIKITGSENLSQGDCIIRTKASEVRGLVMEKLKDIYMSLLAQTEEDIAKIEVFPPLETLENKQEAPGIKDSENKTP